MLVSWGYLWLAIVVDLWEPVRSSGKIDGAVMEYWYVLKKFRQIKRIVNRCNQVDLLLFRLSGLPSVPSPAFLAYRPSAYRSLFSLEENSVDTVRNCFIPQKDERTLKMKPTNNLVGRVVAPSKNVGDSNSRLRAEGTASGPRDPATLCERVDRPAGR